MKKLLQLSLVLVLILSTIATANAQTKKKKTTSKKKDKDVNAEYFEEKGDFWKKICWGIQTDQNLFSLGGRRFSIRLLPSMSYKFSDRFSGGIITKAAYYWLDLSNVSTQLTSYSSLDLTAGLMSRFKISNNIFLHAEFENTRFRRPDTDAQGNLIYDPVPGTNQFELRKQTINETYTYLGLGYSSGSVPGGWGYEASINFDVTNSVKKQRYIDTGLPIDVRIGFMKNF